MVVTFSEPVLDSLDGPEGDHNLQSHAVGEIGRQLRTKGDERPPQRAPKRQAQPAGYQPERNAYAAVLIQSSQRYREQLDKWSLVTGGYISPCSAISLSSRPGVLHICGSPHDLARRAGKNKLLPTLVEPEERGGQMRPTMSFGLTTLRGSNPQPLSARTSRDSSNKRRTSPLGASSIRSTRRPASARPATSRLVSPRAPVRTYSPWPLTAPIASTVTPVHLEDKEAEEAFPTAHHQEILPG